MILGELMSEVVDLDTVVEDSNSELYMDEIAAIMKRPLGIGALVYAKMRRADIEGEVWWNHFAGAIVIKSGRYQGVIKEKQLPDSRTAQVAIVDDFVRWLKTNS